MHTILAFLADANGDSTSSRTHAQTAIAAAAKEHSSFARHATVGLVGSPGTTVLNRLQKLAGA